MARFFQVLRQVLRLAVGVLILSSLGSLLGAYVTAATPPFTQCHADVCGKDSQNLPDEDDEEDEDPKVSLATRLKIRKVAERVYDAQTAYLKALPGLVAGKTSSSEAERISTSLQIAMIEFLKPQDVLGFTKRILELNYSSIPGIGSYSFAMSRDDDFKALLFGIQGDAEKLIDSAPSLADFRSMIDSLLIQLEAPATLPYYTTILPSHRAILRAIRENPRPTREEMSEAYYLQAAVKLLDAGRAPGAFRKKLLVYDLFGEIRHREQFEASLVKYAAEAEKPEARVAFIDSVIESCGPSLDLARKISPSRLQAAAFAKIEKEAKAAVLATIRPYLLPSVQGAVENAIVKTKIAWPMSYPDYRAQLLKRLDLEAEVATDKVARDTSSIIDGIVGMNLISLLGVCEQYTIGEDYTDNIRLVDRTIMISPRAVKDGSAFDVLTHELGHQIELELMRESAEGQGQFEVTQALNNLSTCLMRHHFPFSDLNERFLSEDFADFISARSARLQSENHLCKVHPFSEWNDLKAPLDQLDNSEDHSAPLFRILQSELHRNGKLPNSCVAYAKSVDKEFLSCALFGR